MEYDVVVAGLGGMGSAAAAHCAARGASVLGVEQFARGHALGASSGKSRVIRRAYFESPAYVPLLNRAYELWHTLERKSGARIVHLNGLLTAGYRGSAIVEGAEAAVRLHGLDAQVWDAREIRAHYPALRVDDETWGVFEADAGFVVPEAAVEAQCMLAEAYGAQLRFETRVERWERKGDGVRVELSNGETVRALRLILTLGPWFAETLEALGVPIIVQRNVVAWFAPSRALGVRDMPTFLIDRRDATEAFYGFPDIGDGLKAAFHGHGVATDPGRVDREIDLARDVEPIAAALEAWAPGSAGRYLDAKACMYTFTPDRHFVVDLHPHDRHVVLCGGFSGHGFKFAPVIGEIAADLALDGGTTHDIGFLSIARF